MQVVNGRLLSKKINIDLLSPKISKVTTLKKVSKAKPRPELKKWLTTTTKEDLKKVSNFGAPDSEKSTKTPSKSSKSDTISAINKFQNTRNQNLSTIHQIIETQNDPFPKNSDQNNDSMIDFIFS